MMSHDYWFVWHHSRWLNCEESSHYVECTMHIAWIIFLPKLSRLCRQLRWMSDHKRLIILLIIIAKHVATVFALWSHYVRHEHVRRSEFNVRLTRQRTLPVYWGSSNMLPTYRPHKCITISNYVRSRIGYDFKRRIVSATSPFIFFTWFSEGIGCRWPFDAFVYWMKSPLWLVAHLAELLSKTVNLSDLFLQEPWEKQVSNKLLSMYYLTSNIILNVVYKTADWGNWYSFFVADVIKLKKNTLLLLSILRSLWKLRYPANSFAD